MQNKYIVDLAEVRLSERELVGWKDGLHAYLMAELPSNILMVEEGIDTISVIPDSMLKTIKAIHKIETYIYIS